MEQGNKEQRQLLLEAVEGLTGQMTALSKERCELLEQIVKIDIGLSIGDIVSIESSTDSGNFKLERVDPSYFGKSPYEAVFYSEGVYGIRKSFTYWHGRSDVILKKND